MSGRGLVTRHLTSTEGTGRYQFWNAGWDGLQERPAARVWAPRGTSPGGRSTARSTTTCATRTRSSSRPRPSWGWSGLLLLLGFLGRGDPRGRPPPVWGGEDAGARPACCSPCSAAGSPPRRVEWTWEIPGAFLPVVIVAALLSVRRSGRGPQRAAGRAAAAGGGRGRGRLSPASWRAAIALTSDAKLRASREAAADGDFAKAADEARAAASIQPWAAAPRLQLALIQEEQRPGRGRAGARRGDRARARGLAHLARADPAAGQRRATAPGALRALRRTRAARSALARTSAALLGAAEPRVAARAAPLPISIASLSGPPIMFRTVRRRVTPAPADLPPPRWPRWRRSALAAGGAEAKVPRAFFGAEGDPVSAAAAHRAGRLQPDALGPARDAPAQLQLGLGRAHAGSAARLVLLRHDGRARGPRAGRASWPCWSAARPVRGRRQRLRAAHARRARIAFRRFVRDVVRRYGRGGSFWRSHRGVPRRPIPAYQVWNEPNYPPHWADGAAGARVEYASLLKLTGAARSARTTAARRSARRACSPAPRAGRPGYRYLDALYRVKGIKRYFDAVADPPVLRERRGGGGRAHPHPPA